MDYFQEKFQRKVQQTSIDFQRGLMDEIHWDSKLIGIKGARGVGKTTLLLQYIKKNLPLNHQTLYISLDDIWFSENSLVSLADDFVKQGGQYLLIDEVHKYPNWAQEIKNIYDDHNSLKVVFTGSSLLEILNARADLSRRAIVYTMQGLSFREYIDLVTRKQFPVHSLADILSDHNDISREINAEIKPLHYFKNYCKHGYYPFFREGVDPYFQRLEEIINLIIEIELPLLRKVEVAYVNKLKQLLHIIARSVPFKPNISKLSSRLGINRNTLISYLYFLQESHIIKNLYKNAKGITQLQKPEKIYLENTNLQYALSQRQSDIGHSREAFFINQLAYHHLVEYSTVTDFKVNGELTFEVGGAHKSSKQIKDIAQSFIVSDDIEFGFGNRIPLWLFGFLY